MTQLDSRHARHARPTHRSLRPRDLTIAALLVAVPATVVVCLLFGLGLGANAPGSVALAAALALTILPILGLGAGIARPGSARRVSVLGE